MSLYYEAAKVLEDVADGTKSLKQRVYNDKSLKSAPGAVFALVSETSKWSPILSDVIDESGLLGLERKVAGCLKINYLKLTDLTAYTCVKSGVGP